MLLFTQSLNVNVLLSNNLYLTCDVTHQNGKLKNIGNCLFVLQCLVLNAPSLKTQRKLNFDR